MSILSSQKKEPKGNHTAHEFATSFALPCWKAILVLFCWNAVIPGYLASPACGSIYPLSSQTHTANSIKSASPAEAAFCVLCNYLLYLEEKKSSWNVFNAGL